MSYRFNNGRGALTCETCGVIFKQPAKFEDASKTGDYCAEHSSVIPIGPARTLHERGKNWQAHIRGEKTAYAHVEFDPTKIEILPGDCVGIIVFAELREGICLSRADWVRLIRTMVPVLEQNNGT
jgi:hypothetical protein